MSTREDVAWPRFGSSAQSTIKRTNATYADAHLPKLPSVFIFRTIGKIRNGLAALRRKLVPPDVAVMEQISSNWIGYAIYAAVRLELADKLTDQPRSVAELAQETQTHPEALYRLMRLLASQGIFRQVGDEGFVLTPMAKALQTHERSVKNMVMFQYADYYQRAWRDITYSLQTSKPALEKQLGMPMFEYLEQRPQQAQYFNAAMTYDCLNTAAALISVYKFSGVQTVVDIGGGHGLLLACILAKNPWLQGVLFDLPHVAAQSAATFEEFGVRERVQIVGGDFFQAVPPGADVYIGRNIIHGWDDESCITILENVRDAMPDGGKLLIVGIVIATDNAPSFGKMLNVNMLVSSGGKERTQKEHEILLQAAGLKLNRVISMASPYSIVEAVKA